MRALNCPKHRCGVVLLQIQRSQTECAFLNAGRSMHTRRAVQISFSRRVWIYAVHRCGVRYYEYKDKGMHI